MVSLFPIGVPEVAKRWMQIFSGPLLMHQYLTNADLTRFTSLR